MKRLQRCRHLPIIFHSHCFRRSSFLFRVAVGFIGPWFVPALHYFLISLLRRFRTEHHRLVRTYPAHPFPALTSYHCPKGILAFTRISLPCLPPHPLLGKVPFPTRSGPFPTGRAPSRPQLFPSRQPAGRTPSRPQPFLPDSSPAPLQQLPAAHQRPSRSYRQLTSATPAAPGSSPVPRKQAHKTKASCRQKMKPISKLNIWRSRNVRNHLQREMHRSSRESRLQVVLDSIQIPMRRESLFCFGV